MKCVSDRHQLKRVWRRVKTFRPRHDRSRRARPGYAALLAHHPDHVGLLIDRPHLRELLRDRERDLTGPTSEIQQASAAARLNQREELIQHRRRVRNPEAIVVTSGPAIKTRIELQRIRHTGIVASVA